jgi:hypothetical protein
MKRKRGFVNIELMIWVVMIMVGSAFALPTLVHLLRYRQVSIWDWIAGAIGVILMLLGIAPFVRMTVGGWIESFRKPKR